MGLVVKIPLINANDESAELVTWLQNDGSFVPKGEPLCLLETTKSSAELAAEEAGILRHLVQPGQFYPVGHPIAFVAESENDPVPDLTESSIQHATAQKGGAASWTKKAKIVADKSGIDIQLLVEQNPGITISEAMVQDFIDAKGRTSPTRMAAPSILEYPKDPSYERILILGGGGGASLVLDIVSRTPGLRAVGILDNNAELTGTCVFDTPILGNFELVHALWNDGKFDALISTVVRSTQDRAEVYERFSKIGIPFANIVDPSVRIGKNARLGQGNLVIYGGYIAAETVLGDNNFLAAGTFIEHHSSIGNHCTFGPRTSLSGKVQVGDKVKFGTNVAIEPQLTIGANSLIASGTTITSHVPAGTVAKSVASPVFRTSKP